MRSTLLTYVKPHVQEDPLSMILGIGYLGAMFEREGLPVQCHDERVGSDRDPSNTPPLACDGADCSGRVNARNSFFDRDTNTCPAGFVCDERNPYYDPRYDALGRRIRLEQSVDWTVFLSGVATF